VGATAAGYGAIFGRHEYVIEEVPVPLPGLARVLDGFTIVQLSDIHVGLFVGPKELRAAVELVQRARPDLVVVTGDLVDHELCYLPELGAFLRRLAALAPGRLVVVPGNHDYYAGIQPTLATARAAGARVLFNDGFRIGERSGGFALVGVDDVWAARHGGGPDLDAALAAVPEDLPRVLLCHNPSFFPKAAGRVALQLSGHTHGGQVNLGVPLASFALPYGYVAGEYRREGSRLYVNRGFGTAGPPARLGAPPEVTRVVLLATS
jgi:predicted MPP superfamily phosphohydrolase